MTDTIATGTAKPPTTTATNPKPNNPKVRKPSAKTLARLLAAYLKENNIPLTSTVAELRDKIKSSIVKEEVGSSLDDWA